MRTVRFRSFVLAAGALVIAAGGTQGAGGVLPEVGEAVHDGGRSPRCLT